MDNKIKLLVIGLGVLAAISLLIAFQLNLTNNKIRARNAEIQQELARLNQENDSLTKKLSSVLENNKSMLNSLNEMEQKGKGLQKEIDVLQERLNLVSNERDSLIGKVQKLTEDKKKLQEDLEKGKVKIETKEEAASISTLTSSQQAYWAEVLRQKADAELGLENVKTELRDITYRANELLKEKDASEMELKNLTQVKEDLERRALYNEQLAKALSQDLVREKDDKELVLAQLDKLREDNQLLRSRVKDLEDTKTTLYKKIDSLEEQRATLKNKLDQTERNLAERIDDVVKIKSDIEKSQAKEATLGSSGSRTVELSPIVVHGDQEIAKSALTGRILSVNKQNEFVIIDLGQNSGIKLSNTFGVYRENKYIATVEVIQLRKDISAADIKEVAPQEEIKAQDIVKLIH